MDTQQGVPHSNPRCRHDHVGGASNHSAMKKMTDRGMQRGVKMLPRLLALSAEWTGVPSTEMVSPSESRARRKEARGG